MTHPGSREHARGVTARVGERQDRPSRAQVFVGLRRNLAVAVGRLHQQQPIDVHHLAHRLRVRHRLRERDDVGDVLARGKRCEERVVAARAEAKLDAPRVEDAIALQLADRREKRGRVALGRIDDAAMQDDGALAWHTRTGAPCGR